jgi:hypothetical protein
MSPVSICDRQKEDRFALQERNKDRKHGVRHCIMGEYGGDVAGRGQMRNVGLHNCRGIEEMVGTCQGR